MAFYTGYINLPTTSYADWKAAVNGNGYDADGYYGDQCWDLVSEFWWNIGFPTMYPQTGPNEAASEIWTVSRANNTAYDGTVYFDLIYNIQDIKRGDIVVYDGIPGHTGFADKDYDANDGGLYILGQNQGTGGTPTPIGNPNGGTTANVKKLNLTFLGAFRYRGWVTPPVTRAKQHFPWVLRARKLNQMRNQM